MSEIYMTKKNPKDLILFVQSKLIFWVTNAFLFQYRLVLASFFTMVHKFFYSKVSIFTIKIEVFS